MALAKRSPQVRNWLSNNLTPRQSRELIDSWEFCARTSQLPPPGDWRLWLILTGRAWGKNRAASEWVHDQAAANPGLAGFLAARTLGAVGKTIVGHPRSGLLKTQHASNPCEFKHHLRRVQWANGAYADIHSAEEPDDARGPEYEWGFADEIGTWKRCVDFEGNTTFENLNFSLRGGRHPRMVAVSTPRPVGLVRETLDRAKRLTSIHVTRGTLYDNAENLAPGYIEDLEDKHRGTRLFRQEVMGELLEDFEDAILTHEQLDMTRVDAAPDLARIVIGVDPAGKSKKKSDNTGISVSARGVDGSLYVLANRTCKLSPDGWGRRAVEAYDEFGADLMVAEDNMGGEMVESVIRGVDPHVNVKRRTATRSKTKRAEPVLAFFERGEAHIVGEQTQLEDQLVQFTPSGYVGDSSPDDADAMVWAASELMLGAQSNWDDMVAANG
jgi:phage terminase large subunit-like protein